jgi:hypothetical protein
MVNLIAKGNQNKKLYSTKRKIKKIQKSYVQKNMCFSHMKFKFKFEQNPN